MSLWKEPPTASFREKPGLEAKFLVVAFATSSNSVAIEFQVSISILIPTTPQRMPRDLDGARIVNGEVATSRNSPSGRPKNRGMTTPAADWRVSSLFVRFGRYCDVKATLVAAFAI